MLPQFTLHVTAKPVESQFGFRGTTVTHGAPCRLPHPRVIAGPLRHCGARGSLPPSTALVTAYDLEKSFIFDKTVEITSHVRHPTHVSR